MYYPNNNHGAQCNFATEHDTLTEGWMFIIIIIVLIKRAYGHFSMDKML